MAEPDRAIGSLDILSADERHTILTAWNDTARTIPHTTIPELFAQQAARTPDAVALVFDDATLSYRELDTRSNQLAHHLRTLGAGPETIVGLCVERSFDMVIALIGILKAGAAYLPLDPDYPQQRLRFMLDDAAAPILITHGALRSRLPEHHARIVDLDADRAIIAPQPATPPPGRIDPGTAAYVIYTSGSTGQPKAVTVTHGGIAESGADSTSPASEWACRHASSVRTASASTPRLWEIWLPLCHRRHARASRRAKRHATDARSPR